MRNSFKILLLSHADRRPQSTRLRARKMIAVALVSFVCCTALGLAGCNIPPVEDTGGFGPSKGEVIGAAIGVGAAVATVAILVHNSHHTIKGCILSGPNGLEVQNHANAAPFEIIGLTTNLKVGNVYKLHGSKLKKANSTGNKTFAVEKVGKDFGPCSIKPQAIANSASYR
jgi:hypothetical protein